MFDLQLFLRRISAPIKFRIASDEQARWLDSHQPGLETSGFNEFRTIDHRHLFINSDHVVAARLLQDDLGTVPADYDALWKRRGQATAETGEYAPESWRFSFWLQDCSEMFEIEDLDEHDFVTLSCALLNFKNGGHSFVTVDDEDAEPISLRIADIMFAEGFDCENYDADVEEPTA